MKGRKNGKKKKNSLVKLAFTIQSLDRGTGSLTEKESRRDGGQEGDKERRGLHVLEMSFSLFSFSFSFREKVLGEKNKGKK